MGLAVSLIVCDVIMEDLEERAIASAHYPPHWRYRYINDTRAKHDKEQCHIISKLTKQLPTSERA